MSQVVAGNSINELGVATLARLIANRELSAHEVCAAYIARCQQTHKALNAIVWNRFDEALKDAEAIDAKIARGEAVGPLAGVPFTVKECFYFKGSPCCIGVSSARDDHLWKEPEYDPNTIVGLLSNNPPDSQRFDSVLLTRLMRSGCILLGKTNVPQLMLWHESDNPVYGRTNNPWDLERTPGGSTGGEASIIAAGGSPLGLGNDLGGSLRIPSAWCGLHTLMPTAHRLPNTGTVQNFAWLDAMVTAAGPIARQVEDLDLALRVLSDRGQYESPREAMESEADTISVPWRQFRDLDVTNLRVGVMNDLDGIECSPSVIRAVDEAGAALSAAGAKVFPVKFPLSIMSQYVGLMMADGGTAMSKMAKGSDLDWRANRILAFAGLGSIRRAMLVRFLKWTGQRVMADLIAAGRPRSAYEFGSLILWKNMYRRLAIGWTEVEQFDAVLCPAHALPAPQHGKPIDLISGASYSFLANLLGWPAGVVSTTTVREDEQTGRPKSRDRVLQQAAAVDAGSAGLPVGVQVIARPWREDIVLALMAAIERALPRPQLPASQFKAIGVTP